MTHRDLAKIDLHIHSPAGGDYRGDPSTSASRIASRCAEVGLDVAVLADHMTIEAWREGRHAGCFVGDGLLMLAGVEIKVRFSADEIHLVAVFDDARAESDFSALMEDLRPSVSGNGSPSTIEIAADPALVAGMIKGSGALCVAAHVDRVATAGSPHGVSSVVVDLASKNLVDAIEFDDVTAAACFEEYTPVACVTSSDAHSLEEIGRRHTQIALPELSFEGLRHALKRGAKTVLALRPEQRSCAPTLQ